MQSLEANRKLGKFGSSLIWLLLKAFSCVDCIEPPLHPRVHRPLRHLMFSPGTWAHYTRTGGARVLARIIGDSPYGDEYRTIRYSRHSEDGQKLHIIDHDRASVLVLEEAPVRSPTPSPSRSQSRSPSPPQSRHLSRSPSSPSSPPPAERPDSPGRTPSYLTCLSAVSLLPRPSPFPPLVRPYPAPLPPPCCPCFAPLPPVGGGEILASMCPPYEGEYMALLWGCGFPGVLGIIVLPHAILG